MILAMKTFLLIICLTFFCSLTYGQKGTDLLSVSYGLEQTFIKDKGGIYKGQAQKDYGHVLRAMFERKISNRWSMAVGMGIARRTYSYYVERKNLSFSEVPTGQNSGITASYGEFDTHTVLNSINLSLSNRLYLWPSRLYIAPGLAVERLLTDTNEGTLTLDESEVIPLTSLGFGNKKLNVSGHLELGYMHPITDKIALSIAAYTQVLFLKNELPFTWAEGHYYSFGSSIGICYRFAKLNDIP